MFKKLQVVGVLFCFLSYAEAGTISIGTASARGDLRVDHYNVKGNATLFDGSVVETNLASADLRLNKGTEITMAAASRGTLYKDRIVLQQGQTELTSSGPYQVQANGIRVVPAGSYARGIVSMMPGKTVEVSSIDGNLKVSDGNGITLANIMPGQSLAFAMQAQAAPDSGEFYGVGLVSFDNGTYYLTTDANVKYVLTCTQPSKLVGAKVIVTGTLQGGTTAGNGSMLCVKSMEVNGPGTMSSKTKKWIIAGILVGAGAGAGFAAANQGGTPASR